MLHPELGTGTTQGDFDMARQTKIKFAALATALVATLSLAAVSLATSADSGKTSITHMRGEIGTCC